MLRECMRQQTDDPQRSFPSHEQMKPEPQEIERLRREVIQTVVDERFAS